jgi:hypothetical protein
VEIEALGHVVTVHWLALDRRGLAGVGLTGDRHLGNLARGQDLMLAPMITAWGRKPV